MRVLEIRAGNKEEIEERIASIPNTYYMHEQVTDAVLSEGTWHGSPTPPASMGPRLMPQQARTGTAKRGEEIDHGQEAISVSAHAYLPASRSLIHQNNKSLAGLNTNRLMAVIPNKHLERFIFTRTDVITAIRQFGSVGYLYHIEKLPPTAYLFEQERYKGKHHEIRIPEPVEWDYVVEVGIDDLPHDILITPSGDERLAYFDAFREAYPGHPLELAKEVGLNVMQLIDYLSEEI